jgi:glucose-6-phosphate 1-epimerase
MDSIKDKMMDFQTLPTLTHLSDCVAIVEKDNIKLVRINHAKATAAISLFGGHVLSFQPAGQPDLLWVSEASSFDAKTPIRGGIPICWPWFGGIADPQHGFARNREWTLVEHKENDTGVVITLELETDDSTQAIWPYQFRLLLHVAISEQLNVSLQITNTDEKPWTFSGALHTYLYVGDIRQTATTGMGLTYIDKLQNNTICQGEPTLILTDTIDRIYTAPQTRIQLNDPTLNRILSIENTGHNSAVLWNPWAEKAHTMRDMTDDGYQTMFCIESTIYSPCLSAGITLQPGTQHILTTGIVTEPGRQ